jgi:hypothetical protein
MLNWSTAFTKNKISVLVILLAVMALIFWQVQLGIGERRDFSIPALVFAIYKPRFLNVFSYLCSQATFWLLRIFARVGANPTVTLLIRNYTNRRN